MLSVAEDPEKGSANSVIMELKQIYTFAGELWRICWQFHALCVSTLLPWSLRYSWSRTFFNKRHLYLCVRGCEWVCIRRTCDCTSGNEWDVRTCLNQIRLKVCGEKSFASTPASLEMSLIWNVEEYYCTAHPLPFVQTRGYTVSDEDYLYKVFWERTSHTWQ